MHQKKKAVLFALIGTVVVLNLFVAGLFSYALSASKERKEQEVRTTVETWPCCSTRRSRARPAKSTCR